MGADSELIRVKKTIEALFKDPEIGELGSKMSGLYYYKGEML